VRRNAMRCNATQKGEARPGVDCFRELYIGGSPDWMYGVGTNERLVDRKEERATK